ncbi:MAG TPA: hypothetical protein VLD84_00805 [Nitrososphaeraceae archaeon]|nr:hypothetical protein [Nitrososphaeraceae archaeon]
MNKPLIVVATLALSLVLSFPMMSLTHQQVAAGQQSQEKIDVPLNLTLKAKGDGGEEDNASSTKDVTVNLMVQTSKDGSPTEIPITAKVSNDTKMKDLELCGTMQEGKEMCNSLGDLMKSKGENQSSSETSKSSESDNSTNKNNDGEDN